MIAYHHLLRLSDGRGLFEHALYDAPRPEHGYCVDDVARGLIVLCREADPGPELVALQETYLEFIVAAVAADGSCHNRMNVSGEWTDDPTVEDCWGRTLWALGTAVALGRTASMRAQALLAFKRVSRQRSPHLRAMVFAGLGAGEVLLERPSEASAMRVLTDAVVVLDASPDHGWPWPEERLSYANASIAEAMLLAGQVLGDHRLQSKGLRLLEFLLDLESRDGHLSVTPVTGRGCADWGPDRSDAAFDQQPIEVAALAGACARAHACTGDPRWLEGVKMSWAWFEGDNDCGTPMFDPVSGGGYDGLEPAGRNLNMGAESTLALLSTAQYAERLSPAG